MKIKIDIDIKDLIFEIQTQVEKELDKVWDKAYQKALLKREEVKTEVSERIIAYLKTERKIKGGE